MKNRIIWIFEEQAQEANSQEVNGQQSIQEDVSSFNSSEANSSFTAIPWAMFGALGKSEQENIQRLYRDAYERALAQQEQRIADEQRFERLLDGLEIPVLDGKIQS